MVDQRGTIITRLPAALRVSAGLLTVLPVRSGPVDRDLARAAILVAPVAVLPVAIMVGAVSAAAHWAGLGRPLVGLLAVAAAVLGTRAFHLDGLSDTVDALGSGWDRDKALAIMRRGDIGPMGVVALVLVIGLQAMAYGQLARDLPGAAAVALIIVLSRAALTVVCARPVPAARPDGLGALVAGSVPTPAVIVVAVLTVAVGIPAGLAAGTGAIGGAVASLGGLAATGLLVRHAVRRFGGVSGDIMGAAVELSATVTAVLLLIDYRGLP